MMKHLFISIIGGLFLLMASAAAVAECRAGYIHDIRIDLVSSGVNSDNTFDFTDGSESTDTSGSGTSYGVAGEHCVRSSSAADLYLGWSVLLSSVTSVQEETSAFVEVDTFTTSRLYGISIGWRW